MFESIASAILEHFIISFYYNESQLEFQFTPKARECFERKKIFSSFKALKDDENGILLEVNFDFDDELLNVIKAWIPYIKIIEPKELDIKLKDILKNYIKDSGKCCVY